MATVILDVKNAFYHVWHEEHLHTMLNMNSLPTSIKIIEPFLSKWSFVAHFVDNSSLNHQITAKVSQSWFLYLTLSNIYINDLPEKRTLFTDDSMFIVNNQNTRMTKFTLRIPLNGFRNGE